MNKHLECLSYIIRHKYFVFIAGRKTGVSLWRLLIHDWSKLLPSEWIAYANKFYGNPPIQGPFDRPNRGADVKYWEYVSAYEFDRAWLRHIHRQDHHWQHWVLREDGGEVKCFVIPDAAVREMVADWMGAGRAIHGRWRALEWYTENKKQIQLNYITRIKVEYLLEEMHKLGMA